MTPVVWTCIDSVDPQALAPFWADALGYRVDEPDTEGPYLYLTGPNADAPRIYLQKVPEPKSGKNRPHFDLRTPDSDELITRLVALGATRLGEQREGVTCVRWQVMADPQGNEFCVCEIAVPDAGHAGADAEYADAEYADAEHAGGLLALMPFSGTLGVRLDEATPNRVSGRLDWAPELATSGGAMHGGALMSLADSLAGICAYLNLPEGATTSTIESKTNFFHAVRSGAAVGITAPLHLGRTTIVLQTELRDEEEQLAALVIQTQAVLGGSAGRSAPLAHPDPAPRARPRAPRPGASPRALSSKPFRGDSRQG